MQCFTVTATPVEYEEGCDVLDYENMTINSAYKVKRNTSELTSVSYAAFAYRSNASAIQLNSGKWVMSTDNPNGRIIQKILMTSNNNMTLYMGNDSYSLTGDDGATSTTISKGSDAKEIAGTKTTIDGSTYYVYTPDAEYKYFAITASSSTSVKQIQVYYTEVIKSNPEMEMCEDGTTTAVELKNIDFYMADLYDGNECTKLSYATDSADREAIYSDATITYESSDNKVAKVDENTGDLTIRGMGTAIITASYSGNKNYVPTKATYTINVGLFQPSDNDDSAETDLHCPLIFDEDDTLLTSAYTESGQVLQTDKLTIRYKPGYDLYYSFVYDKSQGEGTLNKNVRAADTDGSNVTYTKLETTESANGDYIYAEISPYTELYASTIQIYAQSQSDSSLKSNTLTLHLDKPTGVHALTAEDGEAEAVYYTLQGQRVKNPERGIYIRVCGNKATKVAL
jgi:hypothetical protein